MKKFGLLGFILTVQANLYEIATVHEIAQLDYQVGKLGQYLPAGNLLHNHWIEFNNTVQAAHESSAQAKLDHLRTVQTALEKMRGDITDQQGVAVNWVKQVAKSVRECQGHVKRDTFYIRSKAQDWVDDQYRWANNTAGVMAVDWSKVKQPSDWAIWGQVFTLGLSEVATTYPVWFEYKHTDDSPNCGNFAMVNGLSYEYYSTAPLLESINKIMGPLEKAIIEERVNAAREEGQKKGQEQIASAFRITSKGNEIRAWLSNSDAKVSSTVTSETRGFGSSVYDRWPSVSERELNSSAVTGQVVGGSQSSVITIEELERRLRAEREEADRRAQTMVNDAVRRANEAAERQDMRRVLANIITIDQNFRNNCTFDGVVNIERYLNERVEALGSVQRVIDYLETERNNIIERLQALASSERQRKSGGSSEEITGEGREVDSKTSSSSSSSSGGGRTPEEELAHAQERARRATARAQKYERRAEEAQRELVSGSNQRIDRANGGSNNNRGNFSRSLEGGSVNQQQAGVSSSTAIIGGGAARASNHEAAAKNQKSNNGSNQQRLDNNASVSRSEIVAANQQASPQTAVNRLNNASIPADQSGKPSLMRTEEQASVSSFSTVSTVSLSKRIEGQPEIVDENNFVIIAQHEENSNSKQDSSKPSKNDSKKK